MRGGESEGVPRTPTRQEAAVLLGWSVLTHQPALIQAGQGSGLCWERGLISSAKWRASWGLGAWGPGECV